MKTEKQAGFVALYGMMIALAFILSYLEAMIPIPIPIPGIKLGLANLVTVVGLYLIGIRGTVAVSLIRIILVGFTFGNLFSMFYGLSGWLLSITVMVFVKRFQWFDEIGISILGGVCHNIGQICIAAWIVKTTGVFYYLPALLIAGIITGAVIGFLGGLIVRRIQPYIKKLL